MLRSTSTTSSQMKEPLRRVALSFVLELGRTRSFARQKELGVVQHSPRKRRRHFLGKQTEESKARYPVPGAKLSSEDPERIPADSIGRQITA